MDNPSGGINLKQSNMDGSDLKDLISDDKDCSCSYFSSVQRSFMIDHSTTKSKPRILFLSQESNDLLETDENGCNCEIAAGNSILGSHVQKFQSDRSNLYWTNSEQQLLSVKDSEYAFEVGKITAQDFLIFGPHMQPFPDEDCLLPELRGLNLDLLESTADSLTILLPEAQLNENCSNKNFATLNYMVLFSEFNESKSYCTDDCTLITTFDAEVKIGRLKPYTKYKFLVTVRNYFVNPEESNVIGPQTFQTAAGGKLHQRS